MMFKIHFVPLIKNFVPFTNYLKSTIIVVTVTPHDSFIKTQNRYLTDLFNTVFEL